MTTPIFSTHGCRLNAYETETMQQLAEKSGVENTIVINSCAVTNEAVRKTRQDIRRRRRSHPGATLIVTGCAAQTDPDRFSTMEEVDMVIGNPNKMQSETWRRLASNALRDAGCVHVDDVMSQTVERTHAIRAFGSYSRAFLKIQNGCDHRCTFCIIPFGRGPSRSVPSASVINQIQQFADNGYREIVLTGVDITSWGNDLPGKPRLGELILNILRRVPDLPRLRISSIDSVEVDDALFEAIADQPRLMPHLHLSLQHGDNMILKRMKRRHTREDAIAFCQKARALRPSMTFGADIIVGFPTETDCHFQNSIRLVEDCRLTWLHVFPFSARDGTPAARMPQVTGATIRERANRLRTIGREAVMHHLSSQIGVKHKILMESSDKGRTEQFAEVIFSEKQTRGDIVHATIDRFSDNTLFATDSLHENHR